MSHLVKPKWGPFLIHCVVWHLTHQPLALSQLLLPQRLDLWTCKHIKYSLILFPPEMYVYVRCTRYQRTIEGRRTIHTNPLHPPPKLDVWTVCVCCVHNTHDLGLLHKKAVGYFMAPNTKKIRKWVWDWWTRRAFEWFEIRVTDAYIIYTAHTHSQLLFATLIPRAYRCIKYLDADLNIGVNEKSRCLLSRI